MGTSTQIDFGIRGTELRVTYITDVLGVRPTSGFDPGETFESKVRVGGEIRPVQRQRPSFGVWHFCTERLIDSSLLEDHAEYLLSRMEPAQRAIHELLESGLYVVQLTFWHVGPAGFELNSKTIGRLASLSHNMSFTCFEQHEEPGTMQQ